jgi:DNA modification methylase
MRLIDSGLPRKKEAVSIETVRRLVAVEPDSDGLVDPRNRLNDLSGKIWIQETKSVWRQRGLGADHEHAQFERLHPAPFSFQDVARLIRFFSKSEQRVLDPFLGVGSTLKACAYLDRLGTGVELSGHWAALARERLECETNNPETQEIIVGDIRDHIDAMPDEHFDFLVTSPPYWSILHKTKDYKAQERIQQGLAHRYGDSELDLGNITDYESFVDELADVFCRLAPKLRLKQYMAIIVSDFKHGQRFYPFHSDLYQRIHLKTGLLELQGVTILEQTHKALKPYGYPYSFVPNVHHQYILILRRVK